MDALELGAAGFWLDERIFAVDDPAASLQAFADLGAYPGGGVI